MAIAAPKALTSSRKSLYLSGAIALAVVAAIGLNTTVVRIGSEADVRQQVFSPDAFGEAEFPRIKSFVTEKALDAATIAPEVLSDKVAAGKKYGTVSSTGAIMMVRVTGVLGESKAGNYDLAVDGMPADIKVRVQTGPAINGTDLRDAPSFAPETLGAAHSDPAPDMAGVGEWYDAAESDGRMEPRDWTPFVGGQVDGARVLGGLGAPAGVSGGQSGASGIGRSGLK